MMNFSKNRIQLMLGDVMVFYYAFFKWGVNKKGNQNMSFTFHKKSQYFFIFLALIHEQIIEFIGFHYLLKEKFPDTFVWLLQVIHIYGIIYLIGDYNLIRRGRIKIIENKICINVGIRKSIEFFISEIESINEINNEGELVQTKNNFYVVATPIFYKSLIGINDEINCQIRLKRQVNAYGFLGISRNAKNIYLSIDQCREFINTIKKEQQV